MSFELRYLCQDRVLSQEEFDSYVEELSQYGSDELSRDELIELQGYSPQLVSVLCDLAEVRGSSDEVDYFEEFLSILNADYRDNLLTESCEKDHGL